MFVAAALGIWWIVEVDDFLFEEFFFRLLSTAIGRQLVLCKFISTSWAFAADKNLKWIKESLVALLSCRF